VTFVPGRKKNPVVDGYRYTKDRSRYGNAFYKCTIFTEGCKAQITLDEREDLVSLPPTHYTDRLALQYSTQARGCLIPFKESLRRALQHIDLVSEYQVLESPVRKFFKILGVFPFLPEDQIDLAWRQVYPLIPADMNSFTDFFEQTWNGTSAWNPLFSHSRWNLHDDTQLQIPRLSNIAEGCRWYHGFRAPMGCSNPAIWCFLSCLKKEQNMTEPST
jgi:hypothetical protein